jgi:hypothetical protein
MYAMAMGRKTRALRSTVTMGLTNLKNEHGQVVSTVVETDWRPRQRRHHIRDQVRSRANVFQDHKVT